MIRTGALLAAALVLTSPAARAQTYPSRQITLIIPFAAGGSNDLVGRAIGKKLAEAWGQPVVVENRGGGGTVIGTAAVAAAPADGHTLLLVSPTFTINPAVRKTMPFDTVKDFTPVAFIARAPLLVTTSTKLPVKSAKELFALARSKPGQITYASAGLGSINQISTEQIAFSAGVKFMHVPYKGGAPALADTVSGHLQFMIENVPGTMPFAREGKLRALAITSRQRSPIAPELPTMIEAGVPDYEMIGWNGFFFPKGTSPEIVARLQAALVSVLAKPEVKEQLATIGAEPVGDSPPAFAAFFKGETTRWGKLIKDLGIKPE
jgi:tripartite-type tricarboxylate transporter receptor subunit TctC